MKPDYAPFRDSLSSEGLALAMINPSTKFEVYLHPLQRYAEVQNIENGWFGVLKGHSMSLEIATFDKAHSSSY